MRSIIIKTAILLWLSGRRREFLGLSMGLISISGCIKVIIQPKFLFLFSICVAWDVKQAQGNVNSCDGIVVASCCAFLNEDQLTSLWMFSNFGTTGKSSIFVG